MKLAKDFEVSVLFSKINEFIKNYAVSNQYTTSLIVIGMILFLIIISVIVAFKDDKKRAK